MVDDERVLIAKLRARDEGAFRELVRRYHGKTSRSLEVQRCLVLRCLWVFSRVREYRRVRGGGT
jgi:hypothetical protein